MSLYRKSALILSMTVAIALCPARAEESTKAHRFRRLVHHGRVLDHPATQPAGTTKPVSYELGKLAQLDRDHVLLTASMREQGGHDFCVGNAAVVFSKLSEIAPASAIPLNRPDPDYRLKSGQGGGVQAKFPGTPGFIPLGALLSDGSPHPAAGTGFFLSTAITFLPDRSRMHPRADWWIDLVQLRWDGQNLQVTQDSLGEKPLGIKLINIGFECLPDQGGLLCPLVCDRGIVVFRFEFRDGRWVPARAGKPFATQKGESEPSIVRYSNEYLVYTRGSDRRGRLYTSADGLEYSFLCDHVNNTVPQALNQGLDGSLYLATNTSSGRLRNPLLAFAMQGQSFVDPVVIHEEKQHHQAPSGTTAMELPFVDHGIAANVHLEGHWRHLLLHRICDVRETDGSGLPPTPNTGLYMAEFEYDTVLNPPFTFGKDR